MELYNFNKLDVGDKVYVPMLDETVELLGIDYQQERVLTLQGLLISRGNIEVYNFKEKESELKRIILGADIGVLSTKIDNLIDSGDEENMALILELFKIKKDKAKQLTMSG